MNELDQFLKDFYDKYGGGADQAKIDAIKSAYGTDHDALVTDLYSKYNQPLDVNKKQLIVQSYGLSNSLEDITQKKSPTVSGSESSELDSIKEQSQLVGDSIGVKAAENVKNREELEPESEDGFGTNLLKSLSRGSASLGAMLARAPEQTYRLFSVPQNALADITGIEEFRTSPEKAAKTFGIPDNKIAEFYEKKAEDGAKEFSKKFDKNLVEYLADGEYGTFFNKLANDVVESLPVSIGILATRGAGASATATTLGGGVVFGAGKAQELKEKGFSENKIAALSTTHGLLEGFFEQFGITKLAPVYKKILLKEGAEKGREVIAKNLMQAYGKPLSKHLGANVEESFGEAFTQLSQNAVDKYLGGQEEKNLMEGVFDAALIGSASSGVFSTPVAPIEVAQSVKDFKDSQQKEAEQSVSPEIENETLPGNTNQEQTGPQNVTVESGVETSVPGFNINITSESKRVEGSKERLAELNKAQDFVIKSLDSNEITEEVRQNADKVDKLINEGRKEAKQLLENEIQVEGVEIDVQEVEGIFELESEGSTYVTVKPTESTKRAEVLTKMADFSEKTRQDSFLEHERVSEKELSTYEATTDAIGKQSADGAYYTPSLTFQITRKLDNIDKIKLKKLLKENGFDGATIFEDRVNLIYWAQGGQVTEDTEIAFENVINSIEKTFNNEGIHGSILGESESEIRKVWEHASDQAYADTEERGYSRVRDSIAKRFPEVNQGQQQQPKGEPEVANTKESKEPPTTRPPPKKERRFTKNSIPKAEDIDSARNAISKVSKGVKDVYNEKGILPSVAKAAEDIDSSGGIEKNVAETLRKGNKGLKFEDAPQEQVRRQVLLLGIGAKLDQAFKDKNKEEVKRLREIALDMRNLISSGGTLSGQASAMLMYWSMTPEGKVANLQADLHEQNAEKRAHLDKKTGKTTEQKIDGLAKELHETFGLLPQEAKDIIKKAFEGKKTLISEGRKDLAKARKKFINSLRKQATSGVPLSKEVIDSLVDMVKALVKISKGNIEKAKTLFASELKDYKINTKEAWDAVVKANPDILKSADFAKIKSKVQSIVAKYERDGTKAKGIEKVYIEAMKQGVFDNNQEMHDKISEIYGIREMPDEQLNKLKNLVAISEEIEGKVAIRKLNEGVAIVSEYLDMSRRDIAMAFWHASVLSSPKTWMAVLAGNTMISLELALEFATLSPGQAMKGAGSAFRGIPFALREMLDSFTTGVAFKNVNKIEKSPILETLAKRPFGQGITKDVTTALAKPAKGTRRIMNGLDALAFYFNHDFMLGREAYKQAKAEGAKNVRKRANEIMLTRKGERKALFTDIKDELTEIAEKRGVKFESLFRDQDVRQIIRERMEGNLTPEAKEIAEERGLLTALALPARGALGFLVHLPKWIRDNTVGAAQPKTKAGKALGGIVEIYLGTLAPYFNTFANIANLSFDYMPVVGAVKKAIESEILPAEFRMKDFDSSQGRIDLLKKQILGAALISMLVGKMIDDDDENFAIYAKGPKNRSKLPEFYDSGAKPFSVKIGGKLYGYRDWPIAGVLMVLGAVHDANKYNNPEDGIDMMTEVSAVLSSYMTNAGMLKQLAQLVKASDDPSSWSAVNMVVGPISGFTNPGIMRYITDMISPEIRERKTYEDKPMGRLAGAFLYNAMIAGDILLDFKYNSHGEPINPSRDMNWFVKGSGLDRYISTSKPIHPVFTEMGKSGVGYGTVGKPKGFTTSEFRLYAATIGRFRRKNADTLLSEIRGLETPEEKKSVIEAYDDAWREIAKYLIGDEELKAEKGNLSLDGEKINLAKIDKVIQEYF